MYTSGSRTRHLTVGLVLDIGLIGSHKSEVRELSSSSVYHEALSVDQGARSRLATGQSVAVCNTSTFPTLPIEDTPQWGFLEGRVRRGG